MSNLKLFNQKIQMPQTQQYLQTVLGKKKDSFVNNVVALVANNTMLQECDPMTIMFAALKATALDLPLDQNLGYAFVIPYKNKKTNTTQAQFQIGSKGLIQLAQRSGQIVRLNVTDIRVGELIGQNLLTGDIDIKIAESRTDLLIVGYAAYIRLSNGFEKTIYMTSNEIEKHGQKYSKTYNFGVWQDNFQAMAEKTVLKRLLSKYAPLSIEMQEAIKADQAVITEEGEEYVDNAVSLLPEPNHEQETQLAEQLVSCIENK